MSILLSDLIDHFPCKIVGDVSQHIIEKIEYRSSDAEHGCLFFCMPGAVRDGHDFAPIAYEAGCRAFVVERTLELPNDSVQIVVDSSRSTLAALSARFFGNPAEKLTLIGITGTKGKTTTSILIQEILCSCGIPCAYIGSNGVIIGDRHFETINTTPESRELQYYFSMMVELGITHVVMEVSSQALNNCRISGLKFHTVIIKSILKAYKTAFVLLFIKSGEYAAYIFTSDIYKVVYCCKGTDPVIALYIIDLAYSFTGAAA